MTQAYVYSKRGSPSQVLRLEEDFKTPVQLEKNQVRIKVKAVGLNPVDWKIMKYAPTFIGKRPAIAGSDYCGTILESNDDEFKKGDEVYGIVHSSIKMQTGLGSLAKEIIAPSHSCTKRPIEKVNVEQAAGISLVGLTAIVLAKEAGLPTSQQQEGQSQKRILVCGGASSVGMALVSILHHRGFYVAATCSRSKDELVRSRGANMTFDYRDGKLTQKLVECTKEKENLFDLVLDCADAFDVWQICGKITKPEASYVNVGMDLTQGVFPALRRLISYFFRPVWLGGVPRPYKRPKEIATKENMIELSKLVNEGVINPIIDSTFPFEKTIDAFTHLMSNKASGKVIVHVQE